MTTSELTGTVLLRVSGGVPTSDVAVREWDIRSCIPAAINYAITGDYWANIQRDDDREIPNNFVAEEEYSGVSVDGKNREYLPFDTKIVNIPGNGGIRYVQDDCGNIYSPRAMGVSKKCFWDKVLAENLEYRYTQGKIYIYGRPSLTENFLVGFIIDSSELDADAELPIPAGKEPEVIDMLVSLFSDQRMQPKDYIIDRIDPVNNVRP